MLHPITIIIHLLPLSGVLGKAQLFSLYGVHFADSNALILMQHRAILFGLIGLYMLYAIAVVNQRIYALTCGLVSVTSFFLIALSIGEYNQSISRVLWVDGFALVLLLLAIVLLKREKKG